MLSPDVVRAERVTSGCDQAGAEIMINNEAIANLIRKGKTYQLPSIITTAKDSGMQSMDASLMRLFKEGKVSAEEVFLKASNKSDFEGLEEALNKSGKSEDAKSAAVAANSGPSAEGTPVASAQVPARRVDADAPH